MCLDHPQGDLGLLQRGQANQAQDAGVGQLADDGELAEVLVEREDATLGKSVAQDLLVARVCRPVAGQDHVVPGGPERSDGAAPDAGVEEDLHVPVGTRKGSTRSWATRRFA